MKNLKMMGLIVLLIVMTIACSKSDTQNSDSNARAIIGDWVAQKITIVSFEDGKLEDSVTLDIKSPQYAKFSFKANHTVVTKSNIEVFTNNDTSYYEISGNKLIVGTSANDPEKETNEFKLEQNSLTIFAKDSGIDDGKPYSQETTVYLIRE